MLYIAHHQVAESGVTSHDMSLSKPALGERIRQRSIVADSRQGSTGSRVRGGGGKLPHGESRSVLAGRVPLPGQEAKVTPMVDVCEAMGLPRDFTDHLPFTMQGKRSIIGNGVPMAMGRAVAQAVRRATADGD